MIIPDGAPKTCSAAKNKIRKRIPPFISGRCSKKAKTSSPSCPQQPFPGSAIAQCLPLNPNEIRRQRASAANFRALGTPQQAFEPMRENLLCPPPKGSLQSGVLQAGQYVAERVKNEERCESELLAATAAESDNLIMMTAFNTLALPVRHISSNIVVFTLGGALGAKCNTRAT